MVVWGRRVGDRNDDVYVRFAEGRKEGCIDGIVMVSQVGKLEID